MSNSTPAAKEDLQTLDERAGDAKFFLSIGSGAFIFLGLILLLPLFLVPVIPLLIPINIASALLIAGFGYLIPGLILFIWGLVKVFRGKDLTFQQVWHASIQRKDVIRTFRFLIFVSFFVLLLIVPVILGVSIIDLMNGIIEWTTLTFGPAGVYLGVFLISIFGNFTVIFPIPYLFILLLIALQPGFTLIDGFILGIIAGAGAAIGETVSWLLGRSQSQSLEESPTGQQILKVREQIEKGYGGFIIFFYAATPLPDDILMIALGATKYPLWKALIFCFFGKVALALIITLGALLPFLTPILLQIFGGGSDPIMDTIYLLIGIALIALFFVPWRRLLQRVRGVSE
ncbi:MAG: VTT domain-containing protein [Candidatus Thorarchaeota archaeon]